MRAISILLYCIVFLYGSVVQSMHQYMTQRMTQTELWQLTLLRCGGRCLHQALDNAAYYDYLEDHNIVIATTQEDENFPMAHVEQRNYGSISPEVSQNFIQAYEVEPFVPAIYAVNSSRHVTVIYEELFTRNPDGTIAMPPLAQEEHYTDNTRNCLHCCVFSSMVSLTCFACIFCRN